MPISARGSCRSARGFTLIELLVVVLLIGIAMSMAVIGLSSDQSRLEETAKRLAGLLDHAGLRARTTGQTLAWQAQEHGYHFMTHGDAWIEVADSSAELLRPRQLPQGMTLQVVKPVSATPMEQVQQATLVFPSSGLARSFELRIADTKNAYRIEGDPSGQITLQRESQP